MQHACIGLSGCGLCCFWGGCGGRGCTAFIGVFAGRRCGLGAAGILEIRCIPAIALELEAGSSDLLDQSFCATKRAGGQWCIRDFLQGILGLTTGAALIGVNWHGQSKNKNAGKPCIIELLGRVPAGVFCLEVFGGTEVATADKWPGGAQCRKGRWVIG